MIVDLALALPKWNVHFIVWVVNNILLKEYPEHLYRIWLYKVFDIKVAIWEENKKKTKRRSWQEGASRRRKTLRGPLLLTYLIFNPSMDI